MEEVMIYFIYIYIYCMYYAKSAKCHDIHVQPCLPPPCHPPSLRHNRGAGGISQGESFREDHLDASLRRADPDHDDHRPAPSA